jgi:hypothetical protein
VSAHPATTEPGGPAPVRPSLAGWDSALEVPGTAALNTSGTARIDSVSCASAGNCTAGGSYTDRSGHQQAFVVSENGGAWQPAEEAPGTATLGAGGGAATAAVSCPSAGNCSAGGSYRDRSGHQQAFLATETGGTWQPAEEAPGTATLNTGGTAYIQSVSCASAGNCSAGGSYTDAAHHQEAFVLTEVGGTWRAAEEVPGTAALNQGRDAGLAAVSCASAGNCSVAGSYTDGSGHQQAFVATETGGRWQPAEEAPGTATLNTGGTAFIESVSCASAGNCSAGGDYLDGSRSEAFVASETGGTWQPAEEAPGTATLNRGGAAVIESVSCPSAGNCSAGGDYLDGFGQQQAFVASETGGAWRPAEEAPGIATLNTGQNAGINSVSCASAGNCSAGGSYASGDSSDTHPFLVNQTNGRWQQAEEAPGTALLDLGRRGVIFSVSCASAGYCSAGGQYDGQGQANFQAFVVSKSSPSLNRLYNLGPWDELGGRWLVPRGSGANA